MSDRISAAEMRRHRERLDQLCSAQAAEVSYQQQHGVASDVATAKADLAAYLWARALADAAIAAHEGQEPSDGYRTQ